MKVCESDVTRTFIPDPYGGEGHWLLKIERPSGTLKQHCATSDVEYREGLSEIVAEYNAKYA